MNINALKKLTLALTLALTACGGGGGDASIIPSAQAAEPVTTCPTGDATALLQNMIDSAKGSLTLPACDYTISSVRISKPLTLTCASPTVNGTIIHFSASEGVVVDPSVVVNVANGGWNQRGYWGSIQNCRIEPTSSGGGAHDLVLRARPGFFISMFRIENNHLGGAGAQGLLMENQGNTDGIFTTRVIGNFIENGVMGLLLGDSVQFIDNEVPNGVNKPNLPGFDLSFVAGAAESTLVRNNISTSGGCVVIRNGTGIGILNNWCESTGQMAAGLTGLLHLTNCVECTVRDNRVQTLSGSAPYALTLDNSQFVAIDSNKLVSGTLGHIAFINGASQNALLGLNRFTGGGDVLTGKIVGGDTGLLKTTAVQKGSK